MQEYNYFTGSPTDPADYSDQFVVNARDIYQDQQMSAPANPYFTVGSGKGYQGPGPGSSLSFYDQNGTQVNQVNIPPNPQPINNPYMPVGNLHYGQQPMQNQQYAVPQSPIMGQLQTPYSPVMQYPQFNGQLQGQMQYSAPGPQYQNYYRDGGPGIVSYRAPGYTGNPALDYIRQQQNRGTIYSQPIYQYGQPQVQERVVHVAGADPLSSGKYLFTADVKDQIEQLQADMIIENQEYLAKREMQMKHQQDTFLSANPVNYGMYYGNYYARNTSMIDPTILSKYRGKVNEILVDAENRRVGYNKNLSKLCHSWLGIDVPEQELDRTYSGYNYTVPQEDIQFAMHQQRIENMVPVNTAAKYWAHDAAVTAEFRKYCPDGRSMNEFFNDCTMLNIREAENEEKHRRMDGKLYYDQDIFHSYLRKYAKEKMIDDSAIDYSTATKGDIMKQLMGQDNVNEFEKDGIHITDEGKFTFNPAENARAHWDSVPENIKNIYRANGEAPPGDRQASPSVTQVIQNENVANYQYNRSKFFQSIFENDKKINYDTGPKINTTPPVNVGGG